MARVLRAALSDPAIRASGRLRGAFVSDLQKLVGVTPDGDFSEATKTALIAWQKAHGLKGLGVWGPKSVAARAWEMA